MDSETLGSLRVGPLMAMVMSSRCALRSSLRVLRCRSRSVQAVVTKPSPAIPAERAAIQARSRLRLLIRVAIVDMIMDVTTMAAGSLHEAVRIF